jgi:hypothetical protein
VHITAAVCVFEEWNDHSGYIPLSNFPECDNKYRTPYKKDVFNKEFRDLRFSQRFI